MIVSASRSPAYWPSAGSVMSHRGPLDLERAMALFLFHGALAATCRRDGETSGALYCAKRAVELGRALLEADDWRRAATGAGRVTLWLAPLRDLMRHLSSAAKS